MIRELAATKDSEGHHKLEPKSVIFIANFWDKVPDNEKDVSPYLYKNIGSLLSVKPEIIVTINFRVFRIASNFVANKFPMFTSL